MTVTASFGGPERFYIPTGSCNFGAQYADLYLSRLKAARPRLEFQARKIWPDLPVRSLAEVKSDEECVIIGTMFRSCTRKPSVIKQLAYMELFGGRQFQDQTAASTATPHDPAEWERFASATEDELFLEDELQRIDLASDGESQVLLDGLTTGVVVALRGIELSRAQGTFRVAGAAFLQPRPMVPIADKTDVNPALPPDLDQGHWILLVSGLGFSGDSVGGSCGRHALALRLLGDFLRSRAATRVERLLLLGDNIGRKSEQAVDAITEEARFLTRHAEAASVAGAVALDAWLAELPLGGGCGLVVQLLPGTADPVSALMPQPPLHRRLLFPRTAARFGGDAIVTSTNPCALEVRGRRLIAMAGQSVRDVYKYTVSGDALTCACRLLQWGHLAPTAPDTLPAAPVDEDPAVGDRLALRVASAETGASPDCPHVLAVGGAPAFGCRTEDASGALVITVPRFDATATAVLLQLESLVCLPLVFDLEDVKA